MNKNMSEIINKKINLLKNPKALAFVMKDQEFVNLLNEQELLLRLPMHEYNIHPRRRVVKKALRLKIKELKMDAVSENEQGNK